MKSMIKYGVLCCLFLFSAVCFADPSAAGGTTTIISQTSGQNVSAGVGGFMAALAMFGALFAIAAFVFLILAIVAMWGVLTKIPDNHKIFPDWFVWIMLVPFFGYIFMWMMMPFGLPKAVSRYQPDNKTAKSIFGLGLAYVILPLFAWIPIIGWMVIIAEFVLLIVYWRKAVRLRDELPELPSAE